MPTQPSVPEALQSVHDHGWNARCELILNDDVKCRMQRLCPWVELNIAMRVRHQAQTLALIEAKPLHWVGGFIRVVAHR